MSGRTGACRSSANFRPPETPESSGTGAALRYVALGLSCRAMNKPPFLRSLSRAGALAGAVVLAQVALSGFAFAQNPAVPKFDLPKAPDKAPPEDQAEIVEWKVQSKGGLLLTSGNSQARTGSLTLDASRQQGKNKLSLNGGIAYGKSNVLVPTLDMATPTPNVVGFTRRSDTATNEWKTRGRYDRFFTMNNAAYGLAQIGGDKIAGKRLYGGAQAGYSRQLLKNEMHTFVAELGYDFSYESYVQTPGKTLDAVAIHSARVFVGELFSLTKETGFNGSVEALFNLNKEKALLASDGTGATTGVGPFKDTRLVGKLGLSTVLRKRLSFGFGVTVKYDQNPAPRPLPGSAGSSVYAPMFQPFADKVDTLTEATMVYTFL
jgi:hypothetical protein